MADGLEDITPTVSIVGADEAQAALRQLGEVGAEAFSKIAEAASEGDFTALATMFGGELAGSFTKAASEAMEFVHSVSESVEILENLSAATGMSVNELQGLGEAFASAGIGTRGFERSMTRLSMTIAQSWASIQESVRTASDQEQSAQLGLQESALATQRAYLQLDETMEKVAQTAVHDQQGIVDAKLNLEKAINSQAKESGVDTSASDKALQQQEAANNVIKARQALYDANQKAADDEAESNLKIQQAALAVQKAKQDQAQAEEKAYETSLKDVPQIASDIENVASGTSKWGDNLKLADVSAQDLTRSIILASSAGGKEPDAAAVLKTLSELFSQTGDKAIDMGQKIEVVSRLMGAGFRAGQASASQLIAVLEKGPEALKAFQQEAENSPFALKKEDTDAIKDFNAAWAELAETVTQVEEKFAALAAPTLTAIFNAVRSAIITAGEALKQFGTFLDQTLGSGAAEKVAQFAAGFAVIFPAVMAVTVVIGTLASGVAALASGVGLVIAAFAAAAAAVTAFITLWPALKNAAQSFVEWFQSSWVGTVIAGIEKAIEKLQQFLGLSKPATNATGQQQSATASSGQAVNNANQQTVDRANVPLDQGGIQILGQAADKTTQAAGQQSQAADKTSSAGETLADAGQQLQAAAAALAAAAAGAGQQKPQGQATGGYIRGPGGPTDDKAGLYALSDGEYVVKSAAVSHYGVGLFEALNSLAVGGFATGGRVGGISIPSSASTGNHVGSSVLNLSIDGQQFNGLRAPADVASKLKNFAVHRQSTSTGRKPSWMR